MSCGDDWESLFELAAGTATAPSVERVDAPSQRPNKDDANFSSDDDEEEEKYEVDRRLLLPSPDCAWGNGGDDRCRCVGCRRSFLGRVRLGPSLCSTSEDGDDDDCRRCDRWEEKIRKGKRTKNKKRRKRPTRTCRNCGRPPSQHEAIAENDDDEDNEASSLRTFVTLRNVRCAASDGNACPDVCVRGARSILSSLAVRRRHRRSEATTIEKRRRVRDEDDRVLLRNRVEALARAAEDSARLASSDSDRRAAFVAQIRVVVAADALYYRYYYLSTIRSDDDGDDDDGGGENARWPNPALWFGTPGAAWDVDAGDDALESLLRTEVFGSGKDNDDTNGNKEEEEKKKVRDWVRNWFGVDERKLDEPHHLHRNHRHDHPLSFMHRNRLCETALIFHKRYSFRTCPETVREFEMALSPSTTTIADTTTRHDTLAPPVLSEWRDSCRDELCHLYAYATLAPAVLKHLPRSLGVRRVVESGAGTGYVASLLRARGAMEVTAYDVAAGVDVWNEYHGASPPFGDDVSRGRAEDEVFRKNDRDDNRAAALLLSYPPPAPSDMARACLRAFTDRGGEVLVHVGEFRGTTGDEAFETRLVSGAFTLERRAPCPTWGTDAAELTVWRARSCDSTTTTTMTTAPLLVCLCGNEATRRCRAARPIAWCGDDACLRRYRAVRRAHAALTAVPNGVVDDPRWYADVTKPTAVATTGGRNPRSITTTTERTRKRRKRAKRRQR